MTPDYYGVLRRSIDELHAPDQATRFGLYESARKNVLQQLRSSDPPVAEAAIDEHLKALYDAAMRIERDLGGEPQPSPPPADDDMRVVLEAPPVAEREPPMREAPPQAAADAPRRPVALIAGALAAVSVAGAAAFYVATREAASPPPAAASATSTPGPGAEKQSAANAAAAAEQRASYVLRPQRVFYRTTQPVGSVIVSRDQRFLYLVQPNQVAIRYAVGVGPGCENVAGLFHVTKKIARLAGQGAPAPASQPGFDVPALYFGPAQAVHRATEPERIGQSARAGCFQAWDADMTDLFGRIPVDERVVVTN
jgi:lipoprotein-anchoring transpeptidase ErfK/SrfK